MSKIAENPWRYIGVDWDSGSWIAVGYPEEGEPFATQFESIEKLWADHGENVKRIVVDVPIGLCEEGNPAGGCVEEDGELSRRCDDLARKVIGPRSSSVFTAPCREAAQKAEDGAEYSNVNQINKRCAQKGLMKQAANISDGIIEVEKLLQRNGDREVLVEGHPELCFRAFAENALQFNKKTAPGVAERLSAMDNCPDYVQGTWRKLAELLAEKEYNTGTDDLLDALVLALTAKADEDFQTLPEDPPKDAEGLKMQMVYRRSEPFEIQQWVETT